MEQLEEQEHKMVVLDIDDGIHELQFETDVVETGVSQNQEYEEL